MSKIVRLSILLIACLLSASAVTGCGQPTSESGPAASPNAKSATAAGKSDDQPAKDSAEKPTIKIRIDQFAFEPSTITVAPGTTVEWTNFDDVPHTVVEANHGFKSDALDTDDLYRHTFNEPGTFNYFCSVHPHMVGEVHVQK